MRLEKPTSTLSETVSSIFNTGGVSKTRRRICASAQIYFALLPSYIDASLGDMITGVVWCALASTPPVSKYKAF